MLKPIYNKLKSAVICLIVFLFIQDNYLFSQNLPDSTLKKLRQLDDTAKVDYLNNHCWELREKDSQLALIYGKRSMQLSDSLDLTHAYGKANNYVGIVLAHYMYRISEAVPYFHRTLEIALHLNDSLSIGFAYNNLGDIYYLTGNAPLALEYAERSMRYMEAMKDSNGIAYTHINFGLVYRFEKKYKLAIKHFNKAIEICKKIGFNLGIASTMHELGIVYYEMKNYNEAIKYYDEAYRRNKEINNKRWMAFSLDGLGKAYYELGQYNKALANINESLKLNKEKNHNYGIISNKIGKALVYSKTKRRKLGEEELDKAVKLAKELGIPTKLLDVYKAIATFYLNVNDYDVAKKSFNSFLNIYDSLYFEQQFETFTELQKIFQLVENLKKARGYLKVNKEKNIT